MKIVKWIVLVIVILAVVAGGYYFGFGRANKKLKTYQNSRYNFSLEYPADWSLGEAPQNDDGREFVSPDGAATCRAYGFTNALTGVSGVAQTSSEYADWIVEIGKQEGDSELISRSAAKLSGQDAVRLSFRRSNVLSDEIYALTPRIGYGITCERNSADKYKNIFDQMVASMKLQ